MGGHRFDVDDVAEVSRHLDALEERYRELEVLEVALRETLRSLRRTRSELGQTLARLDRLDRGALTSESEDETSFSEREGPALRKAGQAESQKPTEFESFGALRRERRP
jgi:hypothetical protein